MATITLEVPAALAARLNQFRPHLPALLAEIMSPGTAKKLLVGLGVAPSRQVFDEMIDFLASGPKSEQIIAYKISGAEQARVRALLDKSRETGLTEVEFAELDIFEAVDSLMILLKAKARLIDGDSASHTGHS